jgi:8-oxo-dGTP diphosphatase
MSASSWLAAVIVVVVRDDRVLALRRSPWESVSGRIERDEEPLDAARREVAEETGLSVRVEPRPVDAYAAPIGELGHMLAVVFRADAEPGEVRRSDEHDEHAWLTPAEIAERGSWPRLVLAIERALAAR